jgi:hypothetical protein
MKDHSFYLTMSYAALVVVVLIEAYRLQQQRRLALRARDVERAAAQLDDGTNAPTPTLQEHAPDPKVALGAGPEGSRPHSHPPGVVRSQSAPEVARRGVDCS